MLVKRRPKPQVANNNKINRLFNPDQAKPDAWGRTPLMKPQNTVQARLKMGKSNDKYEKEADSVANKVVNGSKSKENITPTQNTAQKQEGSLKKKRTSSEPIVQYEVQQGDSPSSIAALFGVSIWDIARFNQGTQESGGYFKPIGDGDYHRYWKRDGLNWRVNPGDYLNITKDAGKKKQVVKEENKVVPIEEALETANEKLKNGNESDLSTVLSQQVLNLISMDAAVTSQTKTAKAFLEAKKNGLVIKDANLGTWKNTWTTGNQYISKETVAATKASFNGGVKSLKIIKGLGIVASFAGGGISIYQYYKGEISGAKLATDLVFTGIAFVPVFGWIISGVYFLGDAVGWDNISNSMERITKKNQAIHGPGWKLMGSGANK
ncbi:MAG: LysM repeat protein [Crocinitomicaceae bacterium]|jgi:LysM repeat protein